MFSRKFIVVGANQISVTEQRATQMNDQRERRETKTNG